LARGIRGGTSNNGATSSATATGAGAAGVGFFDFFFLAFLPPAMEPAAAMQTQHKASTTTHIQIGKKKPEDPDAVESEDPDTRLAELLPEEALALEPVLNEPEAEDAKELPEPMSELPEPEDAKESHAVRVVVTMLTAPSVAPGGTTSAAGIGGAAAPARHTAAARITWRIIFTKRFLFYKNTAQL
jgi:hypothetical protein